MANNPRTIRTDPSATLEPAFTEPRAALAATIFFAVSLVYFLPGLLPGQQVYGTDYLGGGYFFYDFISQRFSSGALPKWVPYIFGGMPLFANPGSTFYPIHVLGDLLFSTAKILPFVYWFQFGIAGFGMYLLSRELGCRNWIAFVSGVLFQFTGITMSWVYAGHDGRIIVATLAPLCFFFLHAGIRTRGLAPFVGAAATIGFALLSFQIQTAYYLLLAAAIFSVFAIVAQEVHRDRPGLVKVVGMGLGAVAFAFVMAAVNFLPFLDYVPESPRGQGEGRGYEYSISYSMPEGEILSMAVPEAAGASVADPTTGEPLFPAYNGENGFKLHTEYVGVVAIMLVAIGAYFSRRQRYWWFFAGLAVLFLTIALGGNTPLYRLYYELLPGTKRFRAPSLSFFIVAMSLVAMAALTLERLATLRDRGRGAGEAGEARLDVAGWIAVAVVGLGFLGAIAASGEPGQAGGPSAAQGWQRFVLFAALSAGAIWFWVRRSFSAPAMVAILALIGMADLWSIGRRFFHTVPPPEEMFVADDVTSFLQSQPGKFRVWSFPVPGVGMWGGNGSYGGDLPMYFGIEQVGGEHPNTLQRWNEYVGAGTQSYIDWHNLITGGRIVGDSTAQAIEIQSTPGFLDAANVKYIVSFAPLVHPSLREVHRGSAVVYENITVLPRAFLVPEVRAVERGQTLSAMTTPGWDPRRTAVVASDAGITLPAGPLEGSAEVVEYEPDRVVVRARASRPALLVLADNMYVGWEATVDGTPTPIHLANHTFRGLVVPAGDHVVELVFKPRGLYTGLYIHIASLLMLAGYGAFLLVARRRARPTREG